MMLLEGFSLRGDWWCEHLRNYCDLAALLPPGIFSSQNSRIVWRIVMALISGRLISGRGQTFPF
eukprot:COSAG01_NODE_1199_length_11292_cov_69.798267_8_plen_64_part_00